MPEPQRDCVTCARPMRYLGRKPLPEYDCMPGTLFDLFECAHCEHTRSWQRVPARQDAGVPAGNGAEVPA